MMFSKVAPNGGIS